MKIYAWVVVYHPEDSGSQIVAVCMTEELAEQLMQDSISKDDSWDEAYYIEKVPLNERQSLHA